MAKKAVKKATPKKAVKKAAPKKAAKKTVEKVVVEKKTSKKYDFKDSDYVVIKLQGVEKTVGGFNANVILNNGKAEFVKVVE